MLSSLFLRVLYNIAFYLFQNPSQVINQARRIFSGGQIKSVTTHYLYK